MATLSPWPRDGFGLERMQALLARLGDPQRSFDAIHVVGTNGKSTATRTIAALLAAEGLRAGAYTSPHVARLVRSGPVDDRAGRARGALARVRAAAEALGATQFEVLTAAAFADFAARGVERRRGRGRTRRPLRRDERPRRAASSLLTNVGLEHTEVLGDDARGDRRARSSPCARPGAIVVLGEPDGSRAACVAGADDRRGSGGTARRGAARQAFLGRPVEPCRGAACPGGSSVERRRDARRRAHARGRRLARSTGCRRPALRRRRARSSPTRTPTGSSSGSPRRSTLVATQLVERPRAPGRRASPRRRPPASTASRPSTTRATALRPRARARTARSS